MDDSEIIELELKSELNESDMKFHAQAPSGNPTRKSNHTFSFNKTLRLKNKQSFVLTGMRKKDTLNEHSPNNLLEGIPSITNALIPRTRFAQGSELLIIVTPQIIRN